MDTEYTLSYTGSQINEKLGKIDSLAEKSEIPKALPNPNKLSLTGAVSAEYDGSEVVEVEIPEQVQSDWVQTDETATNYIKNKPTLATSEEIKALFN